MPTQQNMTPLLKTNGALNQTASNNLAIGSVKRKRLLEQGESPLSKQQKNEVPPLLVLNKADRFKNDSALLCKKVDEDLKNIKILRCQLTKNGNVLIYPKTPEDYHKIINQSLKFDDEKIIEIDTKRLKNRRPSPQLVVHGLNYENALQIEKELLIIGVTEIQEIKSLKTKNKSLNLIGISCDEKIKEKLIKEGICFNYLHYKVSLYKKPARLIQCFKCQAFGHYAIKCEEIIMKCVVCSEHHEDTTKKCKAQTKKCANC